MFPHYQQLDTMDCGPACLRMITKFYGGNYSLQYLKKRTHITKGGVSIDSINNVSKSIGFNTLATKISIDQLIDNHSKPCILHWNKNHFVVCFKIIKRKQKHYFYISDPSFHKSIIYTEEEFKKNWINTPLTSMESGVALFMEPNNKFIKKEESSNVKFNNISFFKTYLSPHKRHIILVLGSMILTCILQLLFPFTTQLLVDKGIKNKDLDIITLLLIAQLTLFSGRIIADFIKNRIILFTNNKINISLISDFLIKLTKLPLHFFDTKKIGDIMQRIGDHSRVESFLTGTSLSMIFSFFNFICFGLILSYYNIYIFLLFFTGNSLYILWILFFMRYRRDIDFKRFAQLSKEQSVLYQIITGMQEIKLNNCEKQKHIKWKQIQFKLFKIKFQSIKIEQYQQAGSIFFNQTTNILIMYLSARSVIEGNITLGIMMSIIYITGQLNAPIEQFVNFIRDFQDAKISIERLNEVYEHPDEDLDICKKIKELPEDNSIHIRNLYFSYNEYEDDYVLKNINLDIPKNKITAIVGSSGSGKTTLIKLLLGFYKHYKGEINIGPTSLNNINPHIWREKIGTVMQDGYIFSDTIIENITIGKHSINNKLLECAVTIANIKEYIESLPLKYDTKIGIEGNGISQGQRQRILIARAVYKNPEYIFLDEATNALDSNNEKRILNQLHSFYTGKTVLIVAHRLSTVKHADNIIVLNHGQIVEQGKHCELIKAKGFYYTLIKNQLDLE